MKTEMVEIAWTVNYYFLKQHRMNPIYILQNAMAA